MGLQAIGIDNRFVHFRAKDKQIDVFVNDCSGYFNGLNPWICSFYAKKFPPISNAEYDISIGSSSIDGSIGKITFDLSPIISDISVGDYIYEVLIEDTYNINRISVVQDRFTILNSLNTDY